jgi:hypothetical protein
MALLLQEWPVLEDRSMIRFLLAKGLSQAKIDHKVVTMYSTNAMTFQSVSHLSW